MKVQQPADPSSSTSESSPGDEPEMPELESTLRECSSLGRAILNHLVHHGTDSLLPPGAERKDLPGEVLSELEQLQEYGLLEATESGYRVPDPVRRLPSGPGRRWDQLSGFWHRLPGSVRNRWLEEAEFLPEPTDPAPLPGALENAEPDRLPESPIEQCRSGSGWISRDSLDVDCPDQLQDLYPWALDEDDGVGILVARGVLLPTWDGQGTVTGFLLREEFYDSPDFPELSGVDPARIDDESLWQRGPFGPRDQLKLLLIVLDALPFRTTLDNYPHLFDVKDAERIAGWDRTHLHGLIHRTRELGLIVPGEDRFYMSSSCEDWEVNPTDAGWWFTRVPPADQIPEDNGTFRWSCDFAPGRYLAEVLQQLEDFGETGVVRSSFLDFLAGQTGLRDIVLAECEHLTHPPDMFRQAASALVNRLFNWGLIDRLEGEEIFLRINDRGQQYRSRKDRSQPTSDDSSLPVILQPDGQLMIPLQAPLENFRHVNPFALLVNVDQMVQYQLDRQSLVQALNDGWDPSDFRDFLQDNASGIPEPVEDLFDEVVGDVEQMTVERVHHLLVFENGSTAANALNALSNYNPMRVDENKVLLQSKTKEETIRRNLARSGIRLRSTSEKGTLSPLRDETNS